MSIEESYLLGDDENTEETNQSFTDLRKHANGLDKKLKATTKELEELRAFKTSYEAEMAEQVLSTTFDELGVDPKRARWFKADNPEAEPTKEAVAAWAVSEGFLQPEQVEGPTQKTGFTPTTLEGAMPGSKRFSKEKWLAVSASDPAEGQRILQQGRVDLSDLRTGLGPSYDR